VVLDEPTAGLDREARSSVWDAVREHARDGGALLLTTHHLEEAEALAQRVVLVEQGAVASDAPLTRLKAAAGTTLVRFRAVPEIELEGERRDGDFVSLLAPDGGVAVESLVRAGVPLRGLEVRPLTLDEALQARDGPR
jgi:ABC-2 type transport system ATP-binding protein